ncbi:nose resistant to fluoxetine protein 6 [Dermacentor silvarum]|uniref:nose resistant to fluoxetine protein 6 n=1 Tax=Dermacentor silvarum TaxID=543639 RepID=UPI0018998741|nr:nose resistant to fluoxetine protein 6 [Dermacentor silvarum]
MALRVLVLTVIFVKIVTSQRTIGGLSEQALPSQAGVLRQFSDGESPSSSVDSQGVAASAVTSESGDGTDGDSEDEPAPNVEAFVQDTIDAAYRKALPMVTKFGFDPAVSGECSQSLLKMALAFRRLEPWAIRMLDASGKVASGLLMGTLGDLGNFDECLATTVDNMYGERDFTGRFCTVYMNFKNNTFVTKMVARFQEKGYLRDYRNPLNWIKNKMAHGVRQSACIPSTCSAEDLAYIINTLGKKIGMKARVRGCKAEGETKVLGWQAGILYTLATVAVLVVSGTMADVALRTVLKKRMHGKEKGNLQNIVLGFSIISNTEKLLKTDPSDPADSKLMFVHGLRFYSSTWVMLGHAFLIADPTSTGSLMNVVDLVEDFMTTLIANAFPSVETFLFISGFLLSYNVQKSLRKKTRLYFWVPLIILRRYIRLTVPAMFVVGVWLLLPLVADGPVLNDYKATFLDTCQRRWWTVLLHTNNFSPFLQMCLGHLWYINIDFQLYVALLFIPLVMIRRPYLGALLAALATVVSSAYTGVVSYLNNYQPAVIFTHTDVSYTIGTANQIYFKPFAHVGSFCIGVLLGYYIYVAPKMKLSKPVQALCWCAATACNLAIVFAPHKWYTDHTYSIERPECLLFAALHRVAWTLGVAWLVLACATGRGGIVMSLLSWPALVPLSRLSYGAFLSHVVILLAQAMTNRERIAYTYVVKTMNYLAVVLASYLCAYLLYLFCEAPVATLERTLLGGIGKPRRGAPSAASGLTVVVPQASDQHAQTSSSMCEAPASLAAPTRNGAAEESTQRSHL